MRGLKGIAVDTFKIAVKAVNPYKAVKNSVNFERCKQLLHVDQQNIPLIGKNVFCCSFGKAGYEMFRAIDELIPTHLAKSVLSLPIGQKSTHLPRWHSQNVKMFFGAANNIGDRNSVEAAREIYTMAENIKNGQILIALISGGGSALLTLPCDGITLEDSQEVTRALFKKASTIQELNTVRKALSKVKGGGLLRAAHNGKVISLILSDIIGDPINMIASAPTVVDDSDPQEAFKIIQKYGLVNTLPDNVVTHLKSRKVTPRNEISSSIVKIVGSNMIALDAASVYLKSMGYESFILSDKLCGEARVAGKLLADLIHELQNNKREKRIKTLIEALLPDLRDRQNNTLDSQISRMIRRTRPLVLLMGGETTVVVKGKGVGGRNQELALAASVRLTELKHANSQCIKMI